MSFKFWLNYQQTSRPNFIVSIPIPSLFPTTPNHHFNTSYHYCIFFKSFSFPGTKGFAINPMIVMNCACQLIVPSSRNWNSWSLQHSPATSIRQAAQHKYPNHRTPSWWIRSPVDDLVGAGLGRNGLCRFRREQSALWSGLGRLWLSSHQIRSKRGRKFGWYWRGRRVRKGHNTSSETMHMTPLD